MREQGSIAVLPQQQLAFIAVLLQQQLAFIAVLLQQQLAFIAVLLQQQLASIPLLPFIKRLVMLNTGHPQTRHPRPVHCALPSSKLFECKRIAITHFIDGQKTAIDRCDHLCLAADNPTCGVRRRQRINRQGFTQGADDLCWSYSLILNHS
jgi:hypothetical protein